MATRSNLKNQKMHRTNKKKLRKQKMKELANRKEKKQQQVTQQAEQEILPYSGALPFEPEELVFTPEETTPISPARRAFQDV
ncbi:MAG: hypothetical protein KAY32_15500 [Candidatus Eisenbacteria sp.]|nr:hypothetical protein [Candidatus Eisenbacteria bacterium]